MELQVDATEVFALAARYAGAPAIVRAEMQTAMTQSVGVIEAQGKANTPVKTGTLRRSITGQAQSYQLGVVGTNVPYARFVHDGTGPHVIVPTSKKALFWPGAAHPVKRVNHPGSKANPFLRKALQQKRGQVHNIWRAMIPRIAARLRG